MRTQVTASKWVRWITLLALPVMLAGIFLARRAVSRATSDPRSPVSFTLQSSAFRPGSSIPARFTCDGDEVSPPLEWHGSPATTRSFALVVDDPDAPGGLWVHWIAYDLPPTRNNLPSLGPGADSLPEGLQGRNSFRHLGYGGPCPPPGPSHRYMFHLYALSVPSLGLAAGATRPQVEAAMRGKILAEAMLMGRFGR